MSQAAIFTRESGRVEHFLISARGESAMKHQSRRTWRLMSLFVGLMLLAGGAAQGGTRPASPHFLVAGKSSFSDTGTRSPTVLQNQSRSIHFYRSPLAATTTNTQICRSYDTNFSDANGSGDSVWAVDDQLGAYAASHAHTTLVPGQVRIASAYATAGHTIYLAPPNPGPMPGRIKLLWHVIGEITTQIQSSFFNRTSASGTASLKLGAIDLTTNSKQEVIVAGPWTVQGQSSKRFGADWSNSGKFFTFSMTFIDGHTYRAYMRVDTSATVGGAFFNPSLQADSLTDFFPTNGFGAYMNYIQWEFDMPSGWTMSCG